MLITGALCAIGAVGVLAFMLLWLRTETRELDEQVAVIAASAAYQQEYTKLTSLLAESEPKRAELEKHILSEDDIIGFLAELEQAGRSFGLVVETKELTEVPIAQGASFPTLKVSMSFKGGAADARHFLELLEALPYASSIDSFSFTELGVPGESAGVAGAITLVVYIQSYE